MATQITKNRGSVALGNVGRSQAQIQREVGCKQSAISHWRSGRYRPSVEWRAKLRDAYGIAVEWWDEPVDSPPALLSTLAIAPPRVAAADAPPPGPVTPAVVRDQAEQLILQINALSESVRTDPMMSPSEKARTMASCATQLKTLGDLTGATRDLSESRILQSPAWKKIAAALLEAVKTAPWTDSVKGDVARVFGEALGELSAHG